MYVVGRKRERSKTEKKRAVKRVGNKEERNIWKKRRRRGEYLQLKVGGLEKAEEKVEVLEKVDGDMK